jgi:DNA-binding winged helix-turn-helix (wHTH) protein
VFSEAEILAAAWPDSPYADARDIKQYIYLLRRRLSDVRSDGRDVIVTVPGFGYRLNDGR